MDCKNDCFFPLLCSALGTQPLAGPLTLSPEQWKSLFYDSAAQMLSAVIYDELSRIGNNMPSEIDAEWKNYAGLCRSLFDSQLLALTHLVQFLEEHGIKLMVLKGVGLSLLYPNPSSRECTDIDIFCFGEYDRVNQLLIDNGLISGIEEENEKHCNFLFDGVNVENHRYFCEYVNDANIITGKAIEALSSTDFIRNPKLPGVFFPGPQMGVHLMMMHTLSHLAWSGIKVRHLVDCGLFFKEYGKDIDWTEALALWEKAGIADAAKLIIEICRKEFALDIPAGPFSVDLNQMAFVLDCTLRGLSSSADVRNPFKKIQIKRSVYRMRKKMHQLVYGFPFPDSFLLSFSFVRKICGK